MFPVLIVFMIAGVIGAATYTEAKPVVSNVPRIERDVRDAMEPTPISPIEPIAEIEPIPEPTPSPTPIVTAKPEDGPQARLKGEEHVIRRFYYPPKGSAE